MIELQAVELESGDIEITRFKPGAATETKVITRHLLETLTRLEYPTVYETIKKCLREIQ